MKVSCCLQTATSPESIKKNSICTHIRVTTEGMSPSLTLQSQLQLQVKTLTSSFRALIFGALAVDCIQFQLLTVDYA